MKPRSCTCLPTGAPTSAPPPTFPSPAPLCRGIRATFQWWPQYPLGLGRYRARLRLAPPGREPRQPRGVAWRGDGIKSPVDSALHCRSQVGMLQDGRDIF